MDDQLVVRTAPELALMEKFVCVRLIHANGLDLTKYDFDYDQSMAVFFLNSEETIYGRFGAASKHGDRARPLSVKGFQATLERILALHSGYPANKVLLAGNKRQLAPLAKFPELLKHDNNRHFTAGLDWDGKVVASCIHCHMIRATSREMLWDAGEMLSDRELRPYPAPEILGFTLASDGAAQVASVAEKSPATAELKAQDRLLTLAGQAVNSLADVQWVLHHAPDAGRLAFTVQRAGAATLVAGHLTLEPGWRRLGDTSWRTSEWNMRRMALGGMKLEPLTAEARATHGLAADALALHVVHVGQYGDHARAKQAGWQRGDVLVSVDEKRTELTETTLIRHLVQHFPKGSQVKALILRGKEERQMVIPMD